MRQTARSVAGRVALVLAAVAVTLVVLEIGLRVLAPMPYSTDLRWLPDGHVKARLDPQQTAINEHGNRVQLNSLGFRGPEPAPEPASGTIRVVVLGGSSTFCYDVTDDAHTWPARLAVLLTQAVGIPVEVVNLGLPGYDAANSKVNYLFTGRALHPHVVVVYHTWNDLKLLRAVDRGPMLPRDALSGRSGASSNVSPLAQLLWDAQLSQRVRRAYLGLRDGAWETYYGSLQGTGRDAEAPIGERGWRWFRQNFIDLVRFARSDGALPVLVSEATLVHPDALGDEARRTTIRNELLDMTLPRLVETWPQTVQILRDVAATEGAVFVDGYDAVPGDLQHLRDHVHLTDAGAERLAEAVAAGIVADPRFRALVARVHAAPARP